MTNELWQSSLGMGMGALFLTLVAILVVVAVWQGFRTWQINLQSKADVARDEANRQLAEEAAALQRGIAQDLSDLRDRVAAIEKILREVE